MRVHSVLHTLDNYIVYASDGWKDDGNVAPFVGGSCIHIRA